MHQISYTRVVQVKLGVMCDWKVRIVVVVLLYSEKWNSDDAYNKSALLDSSVLLDLDMEIHILPHGEL